MKKKIMFFIIMMLFCKSNVMALTYAGCDYSEISRMKSLVSNINISYDYHINNNVAYFDVTLTNVPQSVYFEDSANKIENRWNLSGDEEIFYTYDSTDNGEITLRNYTKSGSYSFYMDVEDCYGVSLGTKYYTFPTYNSYYTSDTCKDIPNFSLCQKWANVNYTKEKFEELAFSYKANLVKIEDDFEEPKYDTNLFDTLVDLYINNYYYFLGAIILICGIIILINRKRNKFKL